MALSLPPEPSPRRILLGTLGVYVLALAGLFRYGSLASALSFSEGGLLNVGSTVAPLVAISAFVERAVEIFITATRGPGALALQRKLAAAGDADKDAVQRSVDAYKLHTQRYSFAVALGLSLFASAVGVRAIAPLLVSPAPTLRWFELFDVAITSLLLAGGSDGIHQVVTTITSFLDTSKSSNRQKAAGADGKPE